MTENGQELPTRHAAKAIVVDTDTRKVLMLRLEPNERAQRGIDEWHIPGGSFEEDMDTSIEETATREVKEEVALDIRIIKEIGKASWDALFEGTPTHFEATFFHAELAQDPAEAVIDTNEAEELAWIDEGDMDQYPALTKEAKEFIPLVLAEYPKL